MVSCKTTAYFLVTVVSGVMVAEIAGGATPGEGAEHPKKPCIAVLEAEVIGKVNPDEERTLAGSLDTLLTESLATQNGFVTADRRALDKVLARIKAKGGGLTKIDAKELASSLRPFVASGATQRDRQLMPVPA